MPTITTSINLVPEFLASAIRQEKKMEGRREGRKGGNNCLQVI